MENYIITTDNTADLPSKFLREHQVPEFYLKYILEEETYDKENGLPSEEFYSKMRNGAMPTTSQINPVEAEDKFEALLKDGNDILHISFSSGLSGSYQSCCIAAEQLRDEYPERRIEIVDSLAASMGEGLLVYNAIQRKEQGASLEEVRTWLEENKLHVCHTFTVDDLMNLYRGGRVSKTAAVLGSMIHMKPILHVDQEGHLIPVAKVRGRKKSLHALVNRMEAQKGDYENEIVFISHADAKEEAEYVAEQVKTRFGVKEVVLHSICPTIGAHSGPGTIALFYMGETR